MSSLIVSNSEQSEYRLRSKFSLPPATNSSVECNDNDYVLQLKSLSDRYQGRWMFSTSSSINSRRIGLIEFREDSSYVIDSIEVLRNDRDFSSRNPKRQRMENEVSIDDNQHEFGETSDELGRATQLNWSNQSGLIIAGFLDSSSIWAWDLRISNNQPVHQLRGSISGSFHCCDQSRDGRLVLGGLSDQDSSQEQLVEAFDLRKPDQPIIKYDQSHSDLISRVKFLKRSNDEYERGERDLICSASLDGLMVTYDLKFEDEDDSVISVCNLGSSVAHCQPIDDYPSIWLGTDMETLAVWKTDKSDLVDHGDIRKEDVSIPDLPVSYLIDCLDLTSSSNLFRSKPRSGYFAGNQDGEIVLVDTSNDVSGNWNLIGSFKGGHQDMVRCAEIDNWSRLIGTGGEDGIICFWSLNQQ
ncbi:quinon protein alcohol dehydrogenase-like superfamily [Phakopsora pachyrhizi]|uniref:Quinon protein alcohol dehydrogenase-like superfamily n=1 Tax=Phakopsora pachyrhizi TaxID=170000 RepID=A0AAV0B5M4_PHAPC|nr:quinon protein alcohol dehydrogenase-like superfamily [Phakopsora pachyrhizi]